MIKSEHKEQVEFVHAAKKHLRELGKDYLIPLLFAIPNGGFRDARTAGVMKMEGVRKGVPDLMFAYPSNNYHGMFIEMKKEVGGTVSKEQQEMLDLLDDQGYYCIVARGAKEAIQAFKEYVI